MNPYHIHVYKLEKMTQMDIMAPDETQARSQALELVKSGKTELTWTLPDATMIAMSFDGFGTTKDKGEEND